MRNVAFSILLVGLAVVQIAVVSSELPRSHVQTAVVTHVQSDARIALVSSEPGHKASAISASSQQSEAFANGRH